MKYKKIIIQFLLLLLALILLILHGVRYIHSVEYCNNTGHEIQVNVINYNQNIKGFHGFFVPTLKEGECSRAFHMNVNTDITQAEFLSYDNSTRYTEKMCELQKEHIGRSKFKSIFAKYRYNIIGEIPRSAPGTIEPPRLGYKCKLDVQITKL